MAMDELIWKNLQFGKPLFFCTVLILTLQKNHHTWNNDEFILIFALFANRWNNEGATYFHRQLSKELGIGGKQVKDIKALGGGAFFG